MSRGPTRQIWLTETPFAHRGLHDATVPENSMAAFAAADRAGFGIELDVRLAKCGTPVVFHDADLRRLTGKSGALAAHTVHELEALRLKGNAESIPTLESVLAAANGRRPTLVEVKNVKTAQERLSKAVGEVVARAPDKVAVMSMSLNCVAQVGGGWPDLMCGWVIDRKQVRQHGLHKAAIAAANVDFVACDHRLLPHPAISDARREGLPVLAWTATSAKRQASLHDHVDNIIFERYCPTRRAV